MIDGNIAALNKYLDDADKYDKVNYCQRCGKKAELEENKLFCDDCVNELLMEKEKGEHYERVEYYQN